MKIALAVVLSTLCLNNTNTPFKTFHHTHAAEAAKREQLESYYHNPDDSDCPVFDEEDVHMGPYEVLAQLVQAEAGNQDLMGKRLVADVVLNRIDNEIFPDSLEEVIFQNGQFAVVSNGAFTKAGWNIDIETYKAVEMEVKHRTNRDVLYFSRGKSKYANEHFKYGDHWFSY